MRKNGYYWARFKDSPNIIVRYQDGWFTACGISEEFGTEEFEYVSAERILTEK